MATEKLFHVLAISGSLRKASYNTALLRAAAEILPPGMMLETLDLSPLPMFNQDYEKPFPEAVAHLRARLAQVDALLIATPEYNSSLSGALKNAIDWASRAPQPPLKDMPVGIIGASTGSFGTLRRSRQPAVAYWLAVAGAVAFCFQTVVLGLFAWTAFFPVL